MVITEDELINSIKQALKNMSRNFVKLSPIVHGAISKDIIEKYQERPFAYEFYHQLRKLMEENLVDFGGYFLQPEVNKEYQHYFKDGKIPDFIIHIPITDKNLVIIELKLATNGEVENDFKKFFDFKREPRLKYDYAVEVIIGNTDLLKTARKRIEKLNKSTGEDIIILWFNTDLWWASTTRQKYFY